MVNIPLPLLSYPSKPPINKHRLRTCFEESPASQITQIALWQAYQVPFARYGAQRPLLPAKDFITNVSNTFTPATAQVLGSPPNQRFVIKGIRPRKTPVDIRGRVYMRCMWHVDNNGRECGEFALWPKHMWEHVVERHLGVAKNAETGKYETGRLEERGATCRWAGCTRFSKAGPNAETDDSAGNQKGPGVPAGAWAGQQEGQVMATPYEVGMHIKTHLPDSSERASLRSKHNQTQTQTDKQKDAAAEDGGATALVRSSWQTQNTQVDERKEAAGLPLSSVLVLRNLARNIPKMEAKKETNAGDGGAIADGAETRACGDEKSLMWRCFAPVKEQLFFVMAYNSSLRVYLPELMRIVDAGGG